MKTLFAYLAVSAVASAPWVVAAAESLFAHQRRWPTGAERDDF